MTQSKKLYGAALLAAFLGSAPLAYADALNDNKVVRSEGDAIVHSYEHGTCVRTRWEAGMDACAPVVKQVSQYVPAPRPYTPRTVLSTEDKTVYFDFNSYALRPDARDRLNGVAQTLRSASDVQSADIVGYADRKGTTSYNQRLSTLRAEAVKNYLAQQGYLNTNVAQVRGLGETDSVTTCDPSLPRDKEISCLAPDRRVEIEIKYLDTQASH